MELEKERFLLNYVESDQIHRRADRLYYHMMQMEEFCDRESIRLVAVISPAEIQIYDGLRKRVKESLGDCIGSKKIDMTLPNRLISEVLTKLEIAHIDLYQDFKREGKNRALYRQRDTHWNIAGNELAASEICRFLTHVF